MEKCVSVIVPSYNRAHLLKKTIPSYIQENVGEVIIVDDASTDNTFDVINELKEIYPEIIYVRMVKNSKQTAAKNEGIRNAKFPYIYFGDDDSFITESTISKLLNTLIEKKADVVGAKALYMDNDEEEKNINEFIAQKSKRFINITEVKKFLDIRNLFFITFDWDYIESLKVPFCNACALVKREILNDIKFDTSYGGNAFREETDLFTRISAAGYTIYYNSSAVQINLPRKQVIKNKSLIKYKLKSSYYEFFNTLKYLKKNYAFLKSYYLINESYLFIWLIYLKDALKIKTQKFITMLFYKN